MVALTQARTAIHPLVPIALAIATGILVNHYRHNSRLSVGLIFIGITCFASAGRVYKRVAASATALLLLSFVCAGYALAFAEVQRILPNRIVTMLDGGAVAPGEPVELTGSINGEPESAPDGFYLSLSAEQVRIRNHDQPASGTIMLMANVGDSSVRANYDRLALHHGARLRVMTVLDRDEDFRNPGVMPFTEYLERKGYDATGVIKSPLLIERLEDGRVFLPLAWLLEWRASLEGEFDRRFSHETAGVLEAMLLGN